VEGRPAPSTACATTAARLGRARGARRATLLAAALCLAIAGAGSVAACGKSATPAQGGTASAAPLPTSSPPTSSPGISPSSPGLQATSPAAAAAAFDSFTAAFYRPFTKHHTYFATDTSGGYADFWKQAEMIEMVEDACDGTHDPRYQRMLVDLEARFRSFYGRSWRNRIWNDDIMWAVIASLRAYRITGDRRYLHAARTNYDIVYARAWTGAFGGGMWWTTKRTQKDVTTTAPAAIAACLLYEDTHDAAYLVQAKAMYAWIRANLYDAQSGAVYDRVARKPSGKGTVVVKTTYTYNQGTFIGAANFLYRLTGRRAYYDDALRTLRYVQDRLSDRGILPSEARGGDENGGGFKGIFVRYAVRFTRDNHLSAFDPWFALNAAAAWRHRDVRGLIGPDWAHPTPSGLLYSWDCSAGVVLLEVVSAP